MRSRVTWIDPQGVETDLNDWTNVWALKGWNNFHAAPVRIDAVEVPLQAGASYGSHRIMARDVDLPLFIMAASRSAFLAKYRQIVSALNTDKGEGRLRILLEDGVVRELRCRYVAGLAGNTGGANWSPGSAQVVLVLRALDPFFYPIDPVTHSFASTGVAITFFPLFPLQLAAGQIFEVQVINNPGDFMAWPVWTITGPCTTVRLINQTSGYTLEASLSLTAGEQVVIDTRPGVKTVRQGTTNLFHLLSVTSVLWGLQRGNNSVQVQLDGSTVDSSATVEFYPPYMSI